MIEKILERLFQRADYLKDAMIENSENGYKNSAEKAMNELIGFRGAIEIVQEVAKEYGNGWISVEERLPKDFRGVLITAIALNGTSYTEIGKWNGEQWFHGASNTRIDIAEVIAWQPLPAPYQKGE